VANLSFETVPIGNMRVHVCSSKKFKTTVLSVFIQQELNRQFVTKNALLPSVLQRGTKRYPHTLALKRRLDEMYGATLFGDVFKRGENHVAQYGMEIANEQYLAGTESLLQAGFSFFSDILTQPVTEKNGFHATYVQAEKKNLKQKMDSLQDDKIRYAAQRMLEEMCVEEPFSLFNHGKMADLQVIDAQNLYAYYQEMMKTCPIDFYCVGDVHTDQVVRQLQQHFHIDMTGSRKTIQTSDITSPVREVKVVIDRLDVKQGKLNMGCRTHTSIQDPAYPALLLYNGVLGGFPHSKLFVHVREKASLAYYCSSRLESHKGILTVQSGIEIAHYDKAVKMIQQQLEAMRQANIDQQELEQTKATLANQFREQQDRAFDLINFHYHSVISGEERPMEKLLEQIAQVTVDDIRQVAEKVQLDTIYFLKDEGGQTDGKN
jgi:predicted Zn-dependent peptidase